MDLEAVLTVPANSADAATLRAALRVAQAALREKQQGAVPAAALVASSVADARHAAVPHSGSGSGGKPHSLMFSVEQLEAMLRREDELRLSPEAQALYRAAELREDTDWMEVADGLQRRVLREFGVAAELEEQGLRHLRAAPHVHPQLKPLAIYHRHQRSRQGEYGEGDAVPPGILLQQLLPPGSNGSSSGGSSSGGGPTGARCRSVSLDELASGPRPLALLASSWGLVGAFNSLHAELRDRADICGIYIVEAHAQDEWPISSARYTPDRQPVLLSQPRTTEERVVAAARFVEQYGFQPPMLVDPIDNSFEAAFAPWPIRFYILWRGRIQYKAQPCNCSYDLSELRARLLALLAKGDQEAAEWQE